MILVLSACGNAETTSTSNNESEAEIIESAETPDEVEIETEPPIEAAEGYDVLGGQLWEVGAIYYRNSIIDIHDSEGLEDLYDSIYLNFYKDGSFIYIDLYPKEGTYTKYDGDGTYDYYLLKTERVLKYDSESGEFVENESSSSSKKTYIIAVLDDDTIEFVEFDSITGKAKADDDPLFFVKSDDESSFISDNKREIANNNDENGSNSGTEANNDNASIGDSSLSENSYESILNEYTKKMEEAVPELVREYNNEASGISDINRLAEICNDKVEDLAEICNEGIEKMANLMYSKGDSYSTYESWAGKLQDEYAELATEIQDAYIDSAMN